MHMTLERTLSKVGRRNGKGQPISDRGLRKDQDLAYGIGSYWQSDIRIYEALERYSSLAPLYLKNGVINNTL